MHTEKSRALGIAFTRMLLGVILLMQGYGKVFTWTVPVIYTKFFAAFEATFLPKWLIWATAYYTSYAELIAGALLILGLFRKIACWLVAVVLLVVSFGHGLLEPIWDLSHVIPRSILLITLLLAPAEWDQWSLDMLRKR